MGIEGHDIDFLHPQNHRFECDGLGACVKNDITVESVSRTHWKTYFGKFSHALDEMVTKGFRRYDLTLASGRQLVVYNMHMDASDRNDVYDGTDQKDRQARLGEWIQLRDDIMERLDDRPVIVVGDLNSFYTRDSIQSNFIEAINATGRAKATDVWVELERKGLYPELREITAGKEREEYEEDGEKFDKIIYINPTNGQQLKAVSFKCDTEDFQYDGKPLSDHDPVSAVFEWVGSGEESGIETLSISQPDSCQWQYRRAIRPERTTPQNCQRKGPLHREKRKRNLQTNRKIRQRYEENDIHTAGIGRHDHSSQRTER